VAQEIADGHLSRKKQRHRTSKKAESDKERAQELAHTRKPQQGWKADRFTLEQTELLL
jgi:hypothetical protein